MNNIMSASSLTKKKLLLTTTAFTSSATLPLRIHQCINPSLIPLSKRPHLNISVPTTFSMSATESNGNGRYIHDSVASSYTDSPIFTATTFPETEFPSSSPVESSIRPRSIRTFSIPFLDNYVIRDWKPRDVHDCIALISEALEAHGLTFDASSPDSPDYDVIEVEKSYRDGEFWVVEDISTGTIVGTSAYHPVKGCEETHVEVRKMYLRPSVRGLGLGKFLLHATETRAAQLGYTTSIVETASVLKSACILYEKSGYTPCNSNSLLKTVRCDMVLQKDITDLLSPKPGQVELIDQTKGWTIARATRDDVGTYRLLFRAVAVLVQQNNSSARILVHRRAVTKKSYPGRMAVLITGCVDYGENPDQSAFREVLEEVGIQDLAFSKPFEPFIGDNKSNLDRGQRIQFHPYVAVGDFEESDIICEQSEVDSAKLMTRKEIIADGIGGSLWAQYRLHGL